ncbi:phosphatase PAP2 family protein [Hymenobacter lapidiphilus]|uniref:prolipoprotein diacylglyceryl transferase family protein n=1 Tax=Hymenobacter sp. CCM 8763 TaxID=2303334 RepID=UPI000E350989|nr:prolipoprotein diacylglyceryl transferase family protein [Hymenobacter sp. CCM 8763]RFP63524.1 phosphatase PAP2 family protein [Hymenobacter sp. CCM 8763]
MSETASLPGKIAYGLSFCVLLPLVLIAWAYYTAAAVPLPVPAAPVLAWLLLGSGLLLIIGGMSSLWLVGGGLPMNAFPPVRFVASGLYRWLPHPIYVGASAVSVGLSLLLRSASGLWLVSPLLTLAWLALVYGFENPDLRRRFPNRLPGGQLVALPAATAAPATLGQRLRVAAIVLLPWLLLYETVLYLGPPAAPISTYLPFELDWPVWPQTEFFYALAYPFVMLALLFIRQQRQLRHFLLAGWLLAGLGGVLHLTLPLVAPPRPFQSDGSVWSQLLLLERLTDGPVAAFPSFHVAWAAVAGYFWGRRWPRLRPLATGLAVLIGLSCLTTGMHSLADVLSGALLGALVLRYRRVGRWLRTGLERLANSWSARQYGSLRVINHSWYAGLAMLAGVLLSGSLLHNAGALLLPVVLGVVGAGLWGQLIEGGAGGLSRPFGYYGALLGGIAGCVVAAWLTRCSFWEVLAACTLALPLVQGVGRLRCVVQGCCHGRPAPRAAGVRVWHPKSRVCALAHLEGRPIHPTAAYSMLANGLIGLLLFRLTYAHVPAPLLVGLYLILSSLARFVEEQFRGEPQTPRAAGLTIYQWMAFGGMLAGIVVTMLPGPALDFRLGWYAPALPLALGAALLAAFAMGMDFPGSGRRFSRLAAS